MSIGHRYGVVLGFALVPAVIRLTHGYQANSLGLPWWVWMLVPAAVWVTVSGTARVWRRPRWLGRVMAVLAVANVAVWWWWWQDMLAFGNALPQHRYGASTVFVLAYVTVAVVAGRSRARKAGQSRPVDDLEGAHR